MQDIVTSFRLAVELIAAGDAQLAEIVLLSLRVSLTAVVVAAVIGFPLGAFLAATRFFGRGAAIVVLNGLMGLPPVVVGLLVYLLLSSAGPFGWLQLLYTPAAMIIAQVVLITPIIAALTCELLTELDNEYDEHLRSFGASGAARAQTLLWEGRYGLLTVALAGFGRAVAEVGAVIIVGGNINHVTRVMTTAIALETARGELALALALGIILISMAITINAAVGGLRRTAHGMAYA